MPISLWFESAAKCTQDVPCVRQALSLWATSPVLTVRCLRCAFTKKDTDTAFPAFGGPGIYLFINQPSKNYYFYTTIGEGHTHTHIQQDMVLVQEIRLTSNSRSSWFTMLSLVQPPLRTVVYKYRLQVTGMMLSHGFCKSPLLCIVIFYTESNPTWA